MRNLTRQRSQWACSDSLSAVVADFAWRLENERLSMAVAFMPPFKAQVLAGSTG
jgi:hypothetical protein